MQPYHSDAEDPWASAIRENYSCSRDIYQAKDNYILGTLNYHYFDTRFYFIPVSCFTIFGIILQFIDTVCISLSHMLCTCTAFEPVNYVIFTTLDPSTRPARLETAIVPSGFLRLSSSSHQPNRKSRAMSLNHGVKRFFGS